MNAKRFAAAGGQLDNTKFYMNKMRQNLLPHLFMSKRIHKISEYLERFGGSLALKAAVMRH